nr:hypothetical protein 2 [Lactuca sativa dicistroviridae]
MGDPQVVSIRESEHECEEIKGLSLEGTDETMGLTTFVQEACSAIDVLGKAYVPTSIVQNSPELQDLKAYFSRPRLIASGSIPAGSRTNFSSLNFTGDTILSTRFPNARERMMGAYGFRYSLVFTLQVAATPFHQGTLAMGWQYGINSTTVGRYYRGSSSATVTNLPHVRLDLSNQTMVTLKVPFLFFAEFMPLFDADFINSDYGALALNMMLPYTSVAGITAPTYKVYLHMEDIELIGGSYSVTRAVTLQAGKKLAPMEEEADNTKRPISETLVNVSSSVKMLGRIPLLSSYASTASWFLDAMAGSAKAFGFSKPTITDVPTKMVLFDNICEHNVDAPSQALVLATSSNNRLEVDPQFSASDIDEMSLAYVLSQFSQVCVGSLGTSSVHGDTIYGTNVGPASMWFRAPLAAPFGNLPVSTTAGASANSFQPSNLMFWSSMFRLWRGGMKFRITFAKTKHHAGRLMLAYQPSCVTSSNGSTYASIRAPEFTGSLLQPFGYSKIIDLKDDNVFEFEVPYTSPAPYTYWYDSIGSFSMTVMDPLLAPSVVANVVHFVVEVCAMPDYELAVPAGVRFPALPLGTVVQQSGKKLSGASGAGASRLTVGEKLLSVKQLISIPTFNYGVQAGFNYSTIALFPWFYHRDPTTTVPAPANAVRYCAFSYGGNAATCYVYARGGTDYHIYLNSDLNVNTDVGFISSDFGAIQTANSLLAQSASSQLRIIGNTRRSHVRVPAYQIYARVPTDLYNRKAWNLNIADPDRNTSFIPTGNGIRFHSAQAYLGIRNANTSTLNQCISRNAADDAMLGQYIGPPPCALPNSVPTAPFDPDFPVGLQ